MTYNREASVRESLLCLPFSDENIENINYESDFMTFLDNHGLYMIVDALERFQEYFRSLKPNEFPNYLFNSLVGIAKHVFAIEWVVCLNPDEVGVHDFPYIFELQNDISYSILLARHGQLKLSNQVLRNVLEITVMHAYFLSLGKKYDDLQNITIPPMNGKKRGMIYHLVCCEIISQEEGNKIGELYSFLSSAVHSQWKFLTFHYEEYPTSDRYLLWIENFRNVLCLTLTMLLHLYRTFPQ